MNSNISNSNSEDTRLTKHFKNESKKLFRNSLINTKVVILGYGYCYSNEHSVLWKN